MRIVTRCVFFFISVLACVHGNAQDNLYARFTTRENQERMYRNLINYTINRNLTLSLNDTTESSWEDAFGALGLLYRNEWVDKKVDTAFENIGQRSKDFQRSLLELAYSNYPSVYRYQTMQLINALLKAGGVEGYCVVVELDDQKAPVRIDELLSQLLKAESLK